MSTDISMLTTSYQVGDRSWLLAEPDYKPNVTLDISKFSRNGTDEVQTITVAGAPTSITLTLGSDTTDAIAFGSAGASAADIQSALEALPNVGAGNVSVSGSAGGPYTATFKFPQAGDVPQLSGTTTGGTSASVTVATSTAGANAHYPNGFIPSGTVIGKVTASGMFGPYDSSASDGRQTAYGLTYGDVRAVRQDGSIASQVGTGAVVYDTAVSVSKLPFQSGTGSIDANGKSDLAQIRWEA